MSETTAARLQAIGVAVAPAVLLVGFAYHPYVTKGLDTEALAAAAAADTTRWGLSHVAIAVGYALLALAFLAIRAYLRDAGEERWSRLALPLLVFGSALFVVLPGMEFAPLVAAETGGDPEAAQDEIVPWVAPLLITAAVSVALGAFALALGIARSGILSRRLRRLVIAALVVMAVARFIPLGAAQIVIGTAAVVALWPLAYAMWRHPVARHVARRKPIPAN
jgi:hypothetical protein